MSETGHLMPMNKFTILVVEDDEPKLRAITQFISDGFPEAHMEVAQSLTAAIDILATEKINLAIVDMSLPTYDFASDRAGGGRPQGFGGADILRFIECESTHTRSVVLTQYEEFPEPGRQIYRTLGELSSELHNELSDKFLGIIHYAGKHGDWRPQLEILIHKLEEEIK